MATLGGKILAISTPYSEMGTMYEQHKAHFGKDGDDHVLIWQAPTSVMNPTISRALIDRELEADPKSARAEGLAEFRTDLQAAFSPESIAACVIPGPANSRHLVSSPTGDLLIRPAGDPTLLLWVLDTARAAERPLSIA